MTTAVKESILLKYMGGRQNVAEDFNHTRYVFDKEKNSGMCRVPIDVAIKLLKTGKYLPVEATSDKGKKKKDKVKVIK